MVGAGQRREAGVAHAWHEGGGIGMGDRVTSPQQRSCGEHVAAEPSHACCRGVSDRTGRITAARVGHSWNSPRMARSTASRSPSSRAPDGLRPPSQVFAVSAQSQIDHGSIW